MYSSLIVGFGFVCSTLALAVPLEIVNPVEVVQDNGFHAFLAADGPPLQGKVAKRDIVSAAYHRHRVMMLPSSTLKTSSSSSTKTSSSSKVSSTSKVSSSSSVKVTSTSSSFKTSTIAPTSSPKPSPSSTLASSSSLVKSSSSSVKSSTTSSAIKSSTTSSAIKSSTTSSAIKSSSSSVVKSSSSSSVVASSSVTCPALGVATDIPSVALAHHNIHRSNHSAPALTYSNTLAQDAAVLAATCNYGHDTSIGGGGYGQNIAVFGSSDPNLPNYDAAGILKGAISDQWYTDELILYPTSNYGNQNIDYSGFEDWGHFSQVVWRSTSQVGCAVQYCAAGTIFDTLGSWYSVCNYGPAGNWGGEYTANVLAPNGCPTVRA